MSFSPVARPANDMPPCLTAPGPFGSAQGLLAEARASAAEFVAAEDAFMRQAVCAVTTTRPEKTGGLGVKVVVRQGPPLRLRALAFEVAYKARRALDQAAIAAATTLGLAERSGGFPFAAGQSLFEAALARCCAGYDAGLAAHFRALRPYGGGDDLLATLGEMAGAMRSQLTVVLELDVARVDVASLGLRGDGPLTFEPPSWNPRKRELHVATAENAGTTVTSRITERTRLPLFVALLGPAVYENRRAAELLGTLIDRVETVVQGVERETGRLGARRPAAGHHPRH